MKAIRNKYIVNLVFILLITTTCNKEKTINNNQQFYFFKTHSEFNNTYAISVTEDEDGGFLCSGLIDDNKSPIIKWKCDKFGNIKRINEVNSFSNNSYFGASLNTKDGGFLHLNYFYPEAKKTDKNSNTVFHIIYDSVGLNQSTIYGNGAEDDSGNYFIPYSRQSTNTLSFFSIISPTGEILNKYFLLGVGEIKNLNIYKVKNNKVYINGSVFNSNALNRTFFGEFDLLDNSTKVKFTNEGNQNIFGHKYISCFTNSKENNLVFIQCNNSPINFKFTNITSSSDHFDLVATKGCCEIEWYKTIFIEGAKNVVPTSIELISNGGYLITGYFITVGQNYLTPFAIKTDQKGTVLIQKTFKLGAEAMFYAGTELHDGSFCFVGGSHGFGKGKEKVKPIIIKANSNLQYN